MEQAHQSLVNWDDWLALGLDIFAEEPAFQRRGSLLSQDEANGPDLFFSPLESNHTGSDNSMFLASTATTSSTQAAEFPALTEGEPLHMIGLNPDYSWYLVLIYILQSLGRLLSLPDLYYKDNQITLPKMNFSALLSQTQACPWPLLRLHPQAPKLSIYLSS